MPRLQIREPRERALVAAVDRLLAIGAALASPFRRAVAPAAPRRILLLRLERIGDLLMTLPAIADVRASAPDATIDLVVGEWNASLATAIADVNRVETLNAKWLAREGAGKTLGQLIAHARTWRARRYDLAINFEPDIRSNTLLAASGAEWKAGYDSGGGGALLDRALEYDPGRHTIENARRLVSSVFGGRSREGSSPRLTIPAPAQTEAARLLRPLTGGPVVAVHVGAGRAVKQWPETRFREVAARLVASRGVSIVFTGAVEDRAQIDQARAGLPADRVLDLSGRADLMTLAALFQRVALLLTVDTGPMHLAHALGTPIVAIFGPSDPVRYAPRGPLDRIVRIDLPCAPCNRIRRPPERCIGHTPDCLAGIDAERVLAAVDEVLALRAASRATGSFG